MAQQLVYTSSPRLLQAGRTGFGTVAMHAGIPSWLQSEIEGFSQFSRLPGLDPSRVILCHTNFGQGDRKYHVFSRIHDCGADYTGRTNHIAHHFIFTAAEIAQATKLGVTPIDVLAYLNHGLWKTAWSGDPAILQPDEELPIISIPKNTITLPAINYWGHLCPDHPEYAAVLAPGKLSEACWLIYPTGWSEPIIYALGESLLLHTNPWAVTFTNNLQPTDNEQLFSWRCIPSDSPLLEKATSSVRPCIDLSNPLPFLTGIPYEFLEQARTGKKPLPKPRSVETALSPLSNIPTTRPAGINIPSPTPSPRPSAPEAGPKVALRPPRTKPRKQKKPAFFITILAIASLLLIGGIVFHYNEDKAKKEIESKRESTFKNWVGISPDSDLKKGNLTLTDCKDINNFVTKFSEKNWPEAEDVIKKLDESGSNHNYINTSMRNAYDKKINEIRTEKYSKLSKLEDFSKIDVTDLKSFVEEFQFTEKAKWTKAIDLLNFLKDGSKTPDPSLTDDSLPSESDKIKEASQNLLAAYKKKQTTPKIVTTPGSDLVQTNPKPIQTPPAKETPIPTPTPKPVPVVNTDPPIYVFFKKPTDYTDLKPELGENFKNLTNNSTLLTLDDAITNATETNGAQFQEDIHSFAVLNKDKSVKHVKHIVLILDKSISEIIQNYENDPKKSVYEIKGQNFSFREDFLKMLERLQDGEKFLTKNREPHLTFTWKLKVTGHDFLNSNGTLSANDLPSIKQDNIDSRINALNNNMTTTKTFFLQSVQKYDSYFDKSDNNKSEIIIRLINKSKEKNTSFISELEKKIAQASMPDGAKAKNSRNTQKDFKYKIISEILNNNCKSMDDFLKNFNDLKEKKTNEKDKKEFHEKFQEELKNIHPENSDINNLAKDYRILKEQELENSLSKPHEDYKKAEQEAKSLNDLVSKTKLPVDLILSYSSQESPDVFMTLKINNFPITNSQAPGGQE